MQLRLTNPRLFVGLAFFTSGIAALVDQVCWQRILALQSGVGIYSIAMIVGAFMAGLGLGSYAGGWLSGRVSHERALVIFVLIELGIGVFAAGSAHLYYDWLYLEHAALFQSPLRAAALHFAGLLFPTALMGMSLPFLVRALVRDVPEAGRIVGTLYGVNVLGASLGALLAPWVLIRLVGIRGALLASAACNGTAALVAMGLARPAARAAPESGLAPLRSGPASEPARPFALFLLLYALSGYTALALEMLWFRVMDVAVKSTAFTFGTVLFVYLLGSGVGSLVGARYVDRITRPLHAFLLCQCLLLASAALALIALVELPAGFPGYRWLVEFWGNPGVLRLLRFSTRPENLARLYLGLPLLLFGLPTLAMGLSFPILQHAVHDEAQSSGRKVGFLQAANIAGCLLGSLFVGLYLLAAFGTMGSFRTLMAAGVVFAIVGIAFYGTRSIFPPLLALLLGLALALPSSRALWLRLHGSADPEALAAEDGTGVTAITPVANPGGERTWRLWVNGKSNSTLPFGGAHTALGAAPVLMHPAPQRVAIIGLGSGDTAWAAGCRHESTQTVRVYELISTQRPLLQNLAAGREPPAKLGRMLEDPRLELVIADGRNALEHTRAEWDVIEMDPTFPHSAYSGQLYSVEFFERCRRSLRPGGLMCSWSPTPRVYASFLAAFPHVVEMAGTSVVVGSTEPIPIALEAWRERARSPQVQAYLAPVRANEVLRDYLETARPAGPPETRDLNHDLFPRDEFDTP